MDVYQVRHNVKHSTSRFGDHMVTTEALSGTVWNSVIFPPRSRAIRRAESRHPAGSRAKFVGPEVFVAFDASWRHNGDYRHRGEDAANDIIAPTFRARPSRRSTTGG